MAVPAGSGVGRVDVTAEECGTFVGVQYDYQDIPSMSNIPTTVVLLQLYCKIGNSNMGFQCANLMQVLALSPSYGQVDGGDFVHVFGNNFMDENDLSCQFGLRKTSTKVVCILPPRIRGNVTVELSLVFSTLHQREFNILVM